MNFLRVPLKDKLSYWASVMSVACSGSAIGQEATSIMSAPKPFEAKGNTLTLLNSKLLKMHDEVT